MDFKIYYSINNKYSNILHSTKWKPYLELYDLHTKIFKNKKNVRILEIGVRHGGSLQSYLQIFDEPIIFGIDINEKCKELERIYNFNILIGSQNNNTFLNNVIHITKTLDIIIDDGSHILDDIYISFKKLFPLLNDNGIYIIEDIHGTYINTDILINNTTNIGKIIKYDQICFIFKNNSNVNKCQIINNLNTIKYHESDRIHIGNIKINNFIEGQK